MQSFITLDEAMGLASTIVIDLGEVTSSATRVPETIEALIVIYLFILPFVLVDFSQASCSIRCRRVRDVRRPVWASCLGRQQDRLCDSNTWSRRLCHNYDSDAKIKRLINRINFLCVPFY